MILMKLYYCDENGESKNKLMKTNLAQAKLTLGLNLTITYFCKEGKMSSLLFQCKDRRTFNHPTGSLSLI